MRRRFIKSGSRGIPANQLWYYVTDDAVLADIILNQNPFDTQVVKHEKRINKCVITCLDDIRVINGVWFGGEEYITNIVIPDSVIEIGDDAFMGCSSITSIVIPDSVTSIGDTALYNCHSLTSVTIGKSTTYLGRRAFLYCNNLKEVYCRPINPPKFGDAPFSNTASNLKIYVPRNSVEAYKKEWKTYASYIEPHEF